MQTYLVRDSSFGVHHLSYKEAIEVIRDWYLDVTSWKTGNVNSEYQKKVVEHINSVDVPTENGDLYDLDIYASRVCEAVAYALDYAALAGHGQYLVKASDIVGLDLRVYLDDKIN